MPQIQLHEFPPSWLFLRQFGTPGPENVWFTEAFAKAVARKVWRDLLKTKTFKAGMNPGWLEFPRFLRDVGLPPGVGYDLRLVGSYTQYRTEYTQWVKCLDLTYSQACRYYQFETGEVKC